VDKATPGVGNGYNVVTAMKALKVAMRRANFTGKADTDKLITALDAMNEPQGTDFPAGTVIMNKQDHQGTGNVYLLKINGQKEDILQTFPANTLPRIGNCTVS